MVSGVVAVLSAAPGSRPCCLPLAAQLFIQSSRALIRRAVASSLFPSSPAGNKPVLQQQYQHQDTRKTKMRKGYRRCIPLNKIRLRYRRKQAKRQRLIDEPQYQQKSAMPSLLLLQQNQKDCLPTQMQTNELQAATASPTVKHAAAAEVCAYFLRRTAL